MHAMADQLAHAAVVVAASPAAVWAMLVHPDTPKRIFPVSEVLAPWRPGEPFAWMFDLLGKPSRVDGTVRRFEAPHLLVYDYVDPHHRDVVHEVTIALTAEGAGTRVDVTQTGNVSPLAHRHAEGGWRLALAQLKGLVELVQG
jgi:uncharacterized protein YndB with AHSA1/START domain